MIINKKKIFKSLSHNNKYIMIDEEKNKVNMIDKEIIKKELFYELLEKHNNNVDKVISIINEKFKKLFYKIETVYVEYNPFEKSELYEKGGFKYYNLFKNTPIRKKMIEIYEEYKKKGKLIDDVLSIVETFPSINLLFDSLTNFNEEYKQYVLNWLSFVFITHKKTRNTIIFKGIEGTGKGLLYEHIIQKVFYNNQTTVISNDELNNSFNEFLENKSFIIANEVQDYTNKKSVYEKLKQWISDTTILLNVKHINMKNIKNLTNFLIYSNNDYPIPITTTDRRYSVINTIDKKLELLVEEKMGIDIIEYIERLNNETETFLYELSKYNFSEKESKKLLYNKEREHIIFNTDEKTKILKHKLKTLDKKFLFEDFITEYLFDIKNEKYFEITNELELGNVNNNIDETHKFIIDDIIEVIETKNFIPTTYLKYFFYFMYYEQKDLKELNKYINKIGEKTPKPIWWRNKSRRGIIIKPINKNNPKTETEILQEENEKLKNEIKQLKKELENERQLNEHRKKEFDNFKKFLIEKGILTKEKLENIYNEFLDKELEKSIELF